MFDWFERIVDDYREGNTLLVFFWIVVGVLFFLFCLVWKNHKLSDEQKSNREELKSRSKRDYDNLRLSNGLFGEEDIKIGFVNRKKSCSRRLIKKGNFVLFGPSACGKSILLRQCFERIYGFRIFKNRIPLYYGASETRCLIQSERQKEDLLHKVKNARFRLYYLFFDGIDELGGCEEQLFDFIEVLISSQRRVKVVLTARKTFLENNSVFERYALFNNLAHVEIHEWDDNELTCLRKNMCKKIDFDEVKKRKVDEILNKTQWINSPLLMKMLFYIAKYDETTEQIQSKYILYNRFVSTVLRRKASAECNKIGGKEAVVSQIAQKAFAAYQKGERIVECSVNYTPMFKANKTFVHESLFEFFVAYNYLSVVKQTSVDSRGRRTNTDIIVLMQAYPNEYADFITDAVNLLSQDERKTVISYLCTILLYTLALEKQRGLRRVIQEGSYPVRHINGGELGRVLGNLTDLEFLTLKDQIIFRFGRLEKATQSERDSLISILEYIYFNDQNVRFGGDCFYVAILKRGCAISSAFLGGEKIEIDYVQHMLANGGYYKPEYDLANRTHTVLFYRDVDKTHSLQNFRDNPDQNQCRKSLNKRIERLRIDLPQSVDAMGERLRKKYYFRLFDLATIYSFVNVRHDCLDDEKLQIIKDCRVDFLGASDERVKIMKFIQESILGSFHRL